MSAEVEQAVTVDSENNMNGKIDNCANNNQPQGYTNRSAPLVKSVREMFLEEYAKDNDQFYEADVEKVKTDDWFVKRFLIARNRNVKNTLKMLVNAMRWRKNERVRDMQPNMFPAEFYKLGGIFLYEKDKEGNTTIYFRIKYLFRISEITEALKKFSAYLMFVFYDNVSSNGMTAVVDFQGTGLKNCELGILRYTITVLTAYLPAGIQHILVVDLPSILRAFWFTTKGWIPENRRKLLKFVNRETITEYIDKENLPKFLEGECPVPYRGDEMVPENCISGLDYGIQHGYEEQRCKEIFEHYLPYINEKD